MGKRLNLFDFIRIGKNRGFTNAINEFKDYIFIDLMQGVEISPREASSKYVPIYSVIVKKGLQYLNDCFSISFNKWIFIDIGCGKGKALLVANYYKFMRVIGIENSKEVYEILFENINKYKSSNIKSILCDANEIAFDDLLASCDLSIDQIQGCVLFAYNPFEINLLVKIVDKWTKESKKCKFYLIFVGDEDVIKHVNNLSLIKEINFGEDKTRKTFIFDIN